MVPVLASVKMLIMQIVDDYSSQALRVLAIAMYQMQALPLTRVACAKGAGRRYGEALWPGRLTKFSRVAKGAARRKVKIAKLRGDNS